MNVEYCDEKNCIDEKKFLNDDENKNDEKKICSLKTFERIRFVHRKIFFNKFNLCFNQFMILKIVF